MRKIFHLELDPTVTTARSFTSGDIRLDLPRALDVKELLSEKAAFITGIQKLVYYSIFVILRPSSKTYQCVLVCMFTKHAFFKDLHSLLSFLFVENNAEMKSYPCTNNYTTNSF